MFTLFFRAIILYILMILVMRAMGKGQLGQYQPYELVMAILLADIFSTPMESVSTPLLYGLIPAAALFTVHSILSLLCLRSDKIRAVLSGTPTVVIRSGTIDQDALRRLCISVSDLMEGLRSAGILDPSSVGTAILEANGTLTAFPDAQSRPPSTRELGISPPKEGMPLPLIVDGRLQKNNLATAGRDAAWLHSLLIPHGLTEKSVYLALLDAQGRMTVTQIGGAMLRFQALPPEEVSWCEAN